MKARGIRLLAAAIACAALATVAAGYLIIRDHGTGSGSLAASSLAISPRLAAGSTVKPAVATIAFSPDGKLLAAGLENGIIQLRSPQTGKVLASVGTEAENSSPAFAFSPDGKTIAVGIDSSSKHSVEFLSTQNMKLIRTVTLNVSSIYSLSFSPDGKTLAIGGGAFLGLLDLGTGSSIYVPDRAPSDVYAPQGEAMNVTFSADGNWIAVSNLNNVVQLWDVRAEKFAKEKAFSPGGRGIPASADPAITIRSVSVSPDGSMVAVGGLILSMTETDGYQGGAMWLWNTKTGSVTSLIRGTISPTDDTGISSVAFNQQGTLLATGDDDGTIQIRNAANGAVISTSYAPVTGYTDVAFSPDGKTLASGEWVQTSEENGLTGGLQLWNVYAPAQTRAPATVTLNDLMSAPVPAACTHPAGTLAYGTQRGLTQDQGFMQLAWLGAGKSEETKLTAFGKLTGGSTEDAATILVCNAGGESWPQIIAFYGPGPRLLGWSYLTSFRVPGEQAGDNTEVNQIVYHDGEISAEWSTQDTGDPDAIATLDYSANLHLVNGKIVATHLTAITDAQAAGQFLSDLRTSNDTAASELAPDGVAAQAETAFRAYPSALTASPACYGLNSFNMPSPVSALTMEGGPSQVSPATQRVCVLPTSNPETQWIALGMKHTGFGKWQVLWLREV